MKQYLRNILVVLSLCTPFTLSLNAHSLEVSAEQTSTEMLESVNRIVDQHLEADWFSGNVAIYHNNSIAFSNSYGLANIAQGTPITAETKIRIGSINKLYTAALVMKLVQSGLLSLDDTLSQFQFGFPQDMASKITVRHLLTHRAGFGDIFIEEYYRTYRSLKTIDDKLPLLMNRPLQHEPGTTRLYSNYGYIVLGAIVEKVTGKSFGEALEDEILHPIGAMNTCYDLTENVTGKAQSYSYSPSGAKTDRTPLLENVTPDGGMYATADDLLIFFSSLFFSDDIINDETKAIMASGYLDTDHKWADIVADPTRSWSSYGGGPGVSAAVEFMFSDKVFIVVLANTDGLVAERISQRIKDVYQGRQPEPARLPIGNFAYQFLQNHGTDRFNQQLETAFSEAGYTDNSERSMNSLGYDLVKQGRMDEALIVLAKNTDLHPESANTFDSLADVYEKTDNLEKALENYRHALTIDPDFSSSLAGVARLEE